MERRTAVCAAGNWIPVGSARTRVRQIRHALLNQLVQTESQFPPTGGERVQSAVSRKSSKLNHTCDRTAHRHRWSGREDQDERVRGPQGTRQKSGRKLAIRPSAQTSLRRRMLADAVKVFLATVYQKHSSLQTRKRKYRG